MDVRRDTESVLALADDVIASLGDGYSVVGIKPYQPGDIVNVRNAPSSVSEKSSQTETCVSNRATQHIVMTKGRATQATLLSHHRAVQTESSSFSSATQTDADVLPDLIRESFRLSTSMICTRLRQIESLWGNFLGRLNRCGTELGRLMGLINSLTNSRDILSKKLRDAQEASKIAALVHLELEERIIICEKEHLSRHNISQLAQRGMIIFYREAEDSFSVAQHELFERLDEIDALQKELFDRERRDISMSSNNVDRCHRFVTLGGIAEDVMEDDTTKEMRKLLSECWSVLAREA